MKVLPHDTELILTKSQEPVKIYFENSKEVMIHTEKKTMAEVEEVTKERGMLYEIRNPFSVCIL